MWRLACSVALRIASGTSRALPAPWPTRPLPSPTTTSAAKPKRRPPFTTLATRLMLTSFSTTSPSSPRPRSRSPPRSRRSPLLSLRAMLWPLLEGQPALAGGIGQGLHPAMKQIGSAVEDHFLDASRDRPFGDQLAHCLGGLDVGACLQRALQRLVDRRGGGQRLAFAVVDDLSIDVQARAEDGEPRPAGGLDLQVMADALLAACARRFAGVWHVVVPTSSCLPCGGSFRPNTSRPCPCKAP